MQEVEGSQRVTLTVATEKFGVCLRRIPVLKLYPRGILSYRCYDPIEYTKVYAFRGCLSV
jgi:hypothetical protein